MLEAYTLPQIIKAVDIAIGDDGMRSKEVAEILKKTDWEDFMFDYDDSTTEVTVHDIKGDVLKLIDKVEELEQKIINLDAYYKMKINECCKQPKKEKK